MAAALVASLASPRGALAQPVAAASEHFQAGQTLFARGDYRAALQRFRSAQRLAPHRATLFNIARCHENLGEPRQALKAYRASLRSTRDPRRRADLQRRIARLAVNPGRIFVTTRPPGARISVDGASKGPASPTLLRLPPGRHVLLLELPGYEPLVRRVDVQPAGEQTVELTLVRRGAASMPACTPAVKLLPAPPSPLIAFKGLQVHGGPGLEVIFAKGWSALIGLSLHAGADIGRFSIGGRVIYLPVRRDGLDTDGRSFLFIAQVELGWTLVWGFAHLMLGGVVGAYLDRISEFREDAQGLREGEEVAGALWGGMVTLGAAATSWLSVDVSLRGGMMHGRRIEAPEQLADDHHFPFIALTAALTLRFGD